MLECHVFDFLLELRPQLSLDLDLFLELITLDLEVLLQLKELLKPIDLVILLVPFKLQPVILRGELIDLLLHLLKICLELPLFINEVLTLAVLSVELLRVLLHGHFVLFLQLLPEILALYVFSLEEVYSLVEVLNIGYLPVQSVDL